MPKLQSRVRDRRINWIKRLRAAFAYHMIDGHSMLNWLKLGGLNSRLENVNLKKLKTFCNKISVKIAFVIIPFIDGLKLNKRIVTICINIYNFGSKVFLFHICLR